MSFEDMPVSIDILIASTEEGAVMSVGGHVGEPSIILNREEVNVSQPMIEAVMSLFFGPAENGEWTGGLYDACCRNIGVTYDGASLKESGVLTFDCYRRHKDFEITVNIKDDTIGIAYCSVRSSEEISFSVRDKEAVLSAYYELRSLMGVMPNDLRQRLVSFFEKVNKSAPVKDRGYPISTPSIKSMGANDSTYTWEGHGYTCVLRFSFTGDSYFDVYLTKPWEKVAECHGFFGDEEAENDVFKLMAKWCPAGGDDSKEIINRLQAKIIELEDKLEQLERCSSIAFISPEKYSEAEYMDIEDAMEDQRIAPLEVVRFERRAVLDYYSAYKTPDGKITIYSDTYDRAKDAFSDVSYLKRKEEEDEEGDITPGPAIFIKHVNGAVVMQAGEWGHGSAIVGPSYPRYTSPEMVKLLSALLFGVEDAKGVKINGLYHLPHCKLDAMFPPNMLSVIANMRIPIRRLYVGAQLDKGTINVSFTNEAGNTNFTFDVKEHGIADVAHWMNMMLED